MSPPVPRLRLTSTEEVKLRQLAHALEVEAVELYEKFLLRHRRRVDTTRWKAVRTHEHLTVHCEREEFRKTWRHSSKTKHLQAPGPMAAMATGSAMPMMLVVGSVQGSLDDALYGNTFLDTASLRVRDEYLDQKPDDASLLAVIDAPFAEDPFYFLGVTHVTRKSATSLGRKRELLLLTGVRAATLSTGERIGLAFHHSIDHPDLPVPSKTSKSCSVRAEASTVAIYRQLDEASVEVLLVDFCDLKGKARSSAAARQSMSLLVPRTEGVDAGLKKKLYWLMRERQRAKSVETPRESSLPIYSHLVAMPEPRVDVTHCDVCDASLRGPAALSSSPCKCQLCGETVCSKCVVSKQIVIDAGDSGVATKRFAFCVACMHHAKAFPSGQIAERELTDLWTRSVVHSQVRVKTSVDDSDRQRLTVKTNDDDSERLRPTSLVD